MAKLPFDQEPYMVETTDNVHHEGSSASADVIGVSDRKYLKVKKEAESDPLKEFTESPQNEDLLSRFQVFCIIINRMMGTGIFESPTIIIKQDRNVGGSLILWGLGCVATIAGTLMYVEYGLTIPRRRMNGEVQAVPRSGGELNYLDYLVKRPKYLAICMFGFVFVIVGNSAANCVSFGLHVLAAAGYENPKKGEVQGVALATAWLVALLHALGRMFGVHLNSVFAVTKVSMLIMIIVLGFMVLNNHTQNLHRDPLSYTSLDSKTSFKHLGTSDNARGFASSYLSIIFTFGGWNQANYVLGEIKKPITRFRGISLWSVGTMCLLYVLTNIAYLIVVPIPQDGIFPQGQTIAGQFFKLTIGKAWNDAGAVRLMNAFLAVSSLGNVIVTTFTAARVKQEIAKEGILPWSLFFARNINIIEWTRKKFFEKRTASAEQPSAQISQASTKKRVAFEPIPLPALLLHCAFSTILILASLRIPRSVDTYPFLVGIYTYTIDALVAVCLSLGMMHMRLSRSSEWNRPGFSSTNRWFSLATAFTVFCANAFPVAALWIPEPSFDVSVPWYAVPTIGWALVFGGLIYYLVFRFAVPLLLGGAQLEVERAPIIDMDDEGHFVQLGEMVYQKWSVPENEDTGMQFPNNYGSGFELAVVH